jgi:catechol 2,3-dioxygenase-like lactoylglutathione lyase family enzyme
LTHLALAVRDAERSRRFYETYFGFDATPAERMSDGVLMLYDAGGFSLALKETDEPISLPSFFHFSFRGASSPEAVRAFRDRLGRDGVPIVEEWDEPDYVSVKCRDPDGYVVEFAWEPG